MEFRHQLATQLVAGKVLGDSRADPYRLSEGTMCLAAILASVSAVTVGNYVPSEPPLGFRFTDGGAPSGSAPPTFLK
jgi:hypothetical protein